MKRQIFLTAINNIMEMKKEMHTWTFSGRTNMNYEVFHVNDSLCNHDKRFTQWVTSIRKRTARWISNANPSRGANTFRALFFYTPMPRAHRWPKPWLQVLIRNRFQLGNKEQKRIEIRVHRLLLSNIGVLSHI